MIPQVLTLLVAVILLSFLVLVRLEAEAGYSNTTVSTAPTRPTVSNATDRTVCGVLEMEY